MFRFPFFSFLVGASRRPTVRCAQSLGIIDRILTELGRQQAKEAGLRFGRELKPFFSPVLVTPAPRTVAAAEIFLSAAHEDANLKPIEVLYDGAS